MRKLFIAIVVGGILLGGVAKAAPDYTVTCKPYYGGSGTPCPSLYVDVDSNGVPVLFADGLEITGNAKVGGNLDVVGYVQAAIGNFTSSVFGVINFFNNSYVSITAGAERLFVQSNLIMFSRWNGTGNCWVTKSLDGSISKYHWTDNSGVDQSTTSLGGVPAQCLNNN